MFGFFPLIVAYSIIIIVLRASSFFVFYYTNDYLNFSNKRRGRSGPFFPNLAPSFRFFTSRPRNPLIFAQSRIMGLFRRTLGALSPVVLSAAPPYCRVYANTRYKRDLIRSLFTRLAGRFSSRGATK